MTRPQFLLDEAGMVPIPAGHNVVSTEVEFLTYALASLPLLVRGTALCRWAREFCSGRDYLWEQVRPAADWLRFNCPSLKNEEAQRIQDMLTQRSDVNPKSYRARDVLETLFNQGPWSEPPGREHAARWLLWLDEQSPEPALWPLLAQVAKDWAHAGPEDIASLYTAYEAAHAREALATWLGITKGGPERQSWGDFPSSVPKRWRSSARAIWEKESLAQRPNLLARVLARHAPYDIRLEAAQMTAEYFQNHAKDLTALVLASLEALLPDKEVAHLRLLCPPDLPDQLPDRVDDVLAWFTGQYLPYRVWEEEHGDNVAHAAALACISQFETWCLKFYPIALVGGAAAEHLAIKRSQLLQQSRLDYVTLWVIFDGMTYSDGQVLSRMLAEEPRLSLGSLTPVLASLPTITQFCKRPLIEGVPPDFVKEGQPFPSWQGARVLERNREAAGALADAAMGDVFVWPLTQPDKTYHDKFDAPTIRRNVQSELERWAKAIRDGAKAVPSHLPLRVVFTTDHGRLLSAAPRALEIPLGMEAHGRTAYGPSGKTFSPSGVLRDELTGLVYLDRDRFRLEKDCVVALGLNVFKTNDGKGGQEWFPHGGLSPEEVVIPWGVITRDLAPPLLRASLTGQGRAGTTQRMQVQLENLGSIPVRALEVTLLVDSVPRSLELDDSEIGPLSLFETSVEITRWPSGQQVEGARASVEFALPGEARITVEASLTLRTQEMQGGRAASLEDLL